MDLTIEDKTIKGRFLYRDPVKSGDVLGMSYFY